MTPTLSHREARRVYDRIGTRQDSQAFYEDPAIEFLLRHGDFGEAAAVFELGCGTGRFALRLFEELLGPKARYRGVDISPRMITIARERLASFGERAELVLTDGEPPVDEPQGAYDRFVSNFVFDLLSEEDIEANVNAAHRLLASGGLLCLSGLSTGVGPFSRAISRLLGWIQTSRPSLVGGCRPLHLLPLVTPPAWEVKHHGKSVTLGITCEALVARRRSA